MEEACSERANSECKGPEARTCSVFRRSSEETIVVEAGSGAQSEMRPEVQTVDPARTRFFTVSETEATWKMTRSCVGFKRIFVAAFIVENRLLGKG